MLRPKTVVCLAPGYRVEFDEARGAFLLACRHGGIEVEESTAAILRLCAQGCSYHEIVDKTVGCSEYTEVSVDAVRGVIEDAHAFGWVVLQQGALVAQVS